MNETTAAKGAPLDDVMLAMDVVDTLRHRRDLAIRELDGKTREEQLIERLRKIYHEQGIEVPDHILREGVSALAESRFVYTPPERSLKTRLAELYVSRARWWRPLVGIAGVLFAVIVGFFFIYQPYQAAQRESARLELAEHLPEEMDALYQTIYEETKVQQAVVQAEDLRTLGKAYAQEGDRQGAQQIVERMTTLRDRLRQEYRLELVNRPGEETGIWTFPDSNTDATNYYLVVEPVGLDGEIQQLPIVNEETGDTELVEKFAVRVPERVYRSVREDKADDGILQMREIGRKSYGFLDVEYAVPVLGGTLTQW
ncbi:hypothetical protein GCM10007989_30210 [Devosia pacifica]|uniref:Uncharacterized protein n=1 Tax=Devosia pacifica TaxID=1335967 RepID=A0A918SC34_9HYPH|nr:DUF6384 family protein [Devosia pacifica]GHA32101.1 hypothetical protein GCM10007989_30210 [Devosia pacifica]